MCSFVNGVICVRSASLNIIISITAEEREDKMRLEERIHPRLAPVLQPRNCRVILWKTGVSRNLCFTEGSLKVQLMQASTLLLDQKIGRPRSRSTEALGDPPLTLAGPHRGTERVDAGTMPWTDFLRQLASC